MVHTLLAASLVSVSGGFAISLHAVCRNSFQDVCILRDMKIHLPVLEIRILECRGEPVLPDWGCQLSLALNLQLVLAPAVLPAALAAFWGLLEEKLGCHKCWGLLAPSCSTRALPAAQLQLHMQHHCPFLADQGYNVRLRGIKIKSFWEWDLILNADMFQPARLVRYPLLERVNTDVLYRRAVVIQR